LLSITDQNVSDAALKQSVETAQGGENNNFSPVEQENKCFSYLTEIHQVVI